MTGGMEIAGVVERVGAIASVRAGSSAGADLIESGLVTVREVQRRRSGSPGAPASQRPCEELGGFGGMWNLVPVKLSHEFGVLAAA